MIVRTTEPVELSAELAELVDVDPQETAEWVESLEAVLRTQGPERARFLLDYIDLLLAENGYERWVINKIRALGSWYTKGVTNGSHLRTAINSAESVNALRELIGEFFFTPVEI